MKKKTERQPSIATRAIHGKKTFAFRGPVASPIYQTSTYRFETSDDAIRYAKGDPSVYVYSRYHNPTVHDVEEKLALMENGEAAALFASGMAAITTAILAVTKAGDTIISTPALYGGTYRWMRDELPKQNITVRFINPNHLEEIAQLADDRTTVVYLETPTNPTLSVVDIAEAVRQTKKAEKKLNHSILTMMDNTFATILNQDPFAFGIDVVTESATKYLGGHADILAGIVVGKEDFVNRVRALGNIPWRLCRSVCGIPARQKSENV